MITELQLENWKSYQKASLHIDPLSVLVGTNASGKSNALDALLLLNRVASGAMLTSALKGDGTQPPVRGGVEWAARQPGSVFALGVVCRADELTDYEYRLEGRITESRCDLNSEQLTRVKYRPSKDGKRKSPAGPGIKLLRTDACIENSPTITARLYNEKQGTPQRFEERCLRLATANPQDWRARLALGRHLFKRERSAEAFEFLLASLEQNPHGLLVHQAVWGVLLKLELNRALVQRYIESARSSVFFLDPHVCLKCHYRSTELLWQCPHCHEWDSFVEERIAPAKEATVEM